MRNLRGIIIIFVLSVVTIALWVQSKESSNIILANIPLSVSQIFGLLGIVLMAISLILSTRLKIVENTFGGMDKVYDTHIIVGGLSTVFALNHPLLLALNSLPEISIAKNYFFIGSNSAYNFGIVALYILLLQLIFIVLIKLPYNIWKFTHKFTGISFMLAGVHALMIGSDISSFPPLKYWLLLFIVIGIQAWIYTVLFYKNFGPRYIYKIVKTERVLDIINIYLVSVTKRVLFSPGQFCYFSFADSKVGNESHPFTISSSPDDPYLRVSIKILGDHTMRFRDLKKDSLVAVYGPYGKFGQHLIGNDYQKIVWIAGGIGITPFVSMFRYYLNRLHNKQIYLFYSYSNKEEALFLDDLGVSNNINVFYWNTAEKGYLDVNKVLHFVGDLNNALIQICGPINMMESMENQFIKAGVNERDIVTEKFSMI
ncbi:hypothetical protein A3A49_01355 [Candidatus Curtissbacteria bacterium RIFCSPLOWO2_01_FULL_38_11b]|uniref:FAD-binding FR-type domain-containing protein n=1 Tax=Candidatus Curtissbacteria bacterium RIFCSPLOWO2_01_FULL_38_11b TaxID=1797725 RepID=A0A1F5GYL5_9BACT|nr:MAG: hypothetical protein A3A49_01355 [Candidatus Curtissbacteria bacterium RIFCSPLOWO2_01_FULL_38_11b]